MNLRWQERTVVQPFLISTAQWYHGVDSHIPLSEAPSSTHCAWAAACDWKQEHAKLFSTQGQILKGLTDIQISLTDKGQQAP